MREVFLYTTKTFFDKFFTVKIVHLHNSYVENCFFTTSDLTFFINFTLSV